MHPDLTDYYTANLELLKKHHPKVWEQMAKNPPEPSGTISCAPNGNPNLTVTNSEGAEVTLHNQAAPDTETADFLQRVPENHTGFVAILGMGLGFAALDILKNRPHLQCLAIFELEPGIFLQALKSVDFSQILTDPRLLLCIGSDTEIAKALAPASRTLQLEDSNVFHQLPSFKYNPSGYNRLKKDLFSHLNALNVGGGTTRRLGIDFFNNRFKHMATIHHHLLLEQLQNKFSGIPAILVAGGPSLDKNIHLLAQAQEKAVIIAVDTVLPTLLKHGVHPHFLTCIDPYDLTYEKFADVAPKAKDIALICSSWVTPQTPKTFPADQTFWTFTAKHVEAWLNSLLGGKISTGGATTVAHLNLIAADMLGCDPIIFIGQDLAFPDSATHATDAVLHGSSPKGVPIANTEGETVMGIDGKVMRTNRSFLSMKEHFEAAIARSSRTYINATAVGADIKGTKILNFQEAIDKHCKVEIETTQRLKKYYTELKPISPQKMLVEFNSMISKAKKLSQSIEKSDRLSHSALKSLKKLEKSNTRIQSFGMLPLQLQQQINKIDHLHQKLDNAPNIWTFLDETTMEGLKESERQKQKIAMLQNDPKKYSLWLKANLNRLIAINKVRSESLTMLLNNLAMVISFHQKENNCLKKIAKGHQKEKNRLELTRLYMNSKNYFLARPVLEKLYQAIPDSGEVNFHLGCMAAQFAEHEKAAEYFSTAKQHDPALNKDIAVFRQDLGDTFFSYYEYFITLPGYEASQRYMLRKGLKYSPDHSELIKGVETLLKKDLKDIASDLDEENYQDATALIIEWHQTVAEQKNLASALSPELAGELFLNHGKLKLKENKSSEALASFEKALHYSPLSHDLHLFTIEALFAEGHFNKAIEALNKAISLDNKFATYWETIGDTLMANGQSEDAILAYERCFVRLPDNIQILKKIGDCYMNTGQLEAAKAAYEQLKLELQKRDASPVNNQ